MVALSSKVAPKVAPCLAVSAVIEPPFQVSHAITASLVACGASAANGLKSAVSKLGLAAVCMLHATKPVMQRDLPSGRVHVGGSGSTVHGPATTELFAQRCVVEPANPIYLFLYSFTVKISLLTVSYIP